MQNLFLLEFEIKIKMLCSDPQLKQYHIKHFVIVEICTNKYVNGRECIVSRRRRSRHQDFSSDSALEAYVHH
jgi:hypothetical protein